MAVPKSHPRYASLKTREAIAKGVDKGITSIHGLIAHGRGEAFDYLISEKTNDFAKKAINAAAAMLLLANNPVISVNGNCAALVPKEIVLLSKAVPAKLEVNIFHASKKREKSIKTHLMSYGADDVLLPDFEYLKIIEHNRRFANKKGIAKADLVFVPLEDGDRCLALKKAGKKIITIDLNPLSRTARAADITIVDNIGRCLPLLISKVNQYKKIDKTTLERIVKNYDNKKILKLALLQVSSF